MSESTSAPTGSSAEHGGARAATFGRALERLLASCGMGGAARDAHRSVDELHAAGPPPRLGVTELSVTAPPGGAPSVRLLAEVVDVVPASPPAFDATLAQVRRAAAGAGVPLDEERLARLMPAIVPAGSSARERPLRTGLTLGWNAGGQRTAKAYFDLGAPDRDAAPEHLHAALDHAGLGHAWPALCDFAGQTPPICQGVGVDIAAGRGDHLRPYLHGAGFTVDGLRGWLRASGHERALAPFDAFAAIVTGHAGAGKPLRGMLAAPTLHAAADGPIALKLDACLPVLMPDDAAALDATARLAAALGVDPALWPAAVTAVCGRRELARTRGLLHYLSLAIEPDGRPRMALYVRPLRPVNPHQPRSLRPRGKPPDLARVDHAIRAAVAFLERDRAAGRPAAAHHMAFPAGMRPNGELEIHRGEVFASAYAGNALAAARHAGFEVDDAGLAADVEALTRWRDERVSGGWRYFPTLPELPPDADDLAEVVRLVADVAPARLGPLCGLAVEVALDDWCADGARSTWLIGDGDPSAERRRMRDAIDRCWGDSSDCEVIANLADAIAGAAAPLDCPLSEQSGLAERVAAACAWVVGQQRPDGTWPGTWYVEPLYGTWMAARLVARVQPGHSSLRRARAAAERLVRSPGDDDDAAATALALLVLVAVDESIPLPRAAARRAAAHLLASQRPDGGWPARPLIRMEPLRAVRRDGPVLLHANEALTCALALTALAGARTLAW